MKFSKQHGHFDPRAVIRALVAASVIVVAIVAGVAVSAYFALPQVFR